MEITFHCEHCGKEVKAPEPSAGKRGKCPHCHNVCYIPSPPDQLEEYDLAPVDPEEERRRQNEEAAARALQRKLLSERKEVEGPDKPPPVQEDETVRPGDLESLVTDFVNAMGRGSLEEADRLAAILKGNKKEVQTLIERIGADELLSAKISSLPRPVMLGFLKQLRSKIA